MDRHCIFLIISMVCIFTSGIITGYSNCKSSLQKEAIANGVAKYVVIDNQGTTEFKWIKSEIK